jgi:hypothetical protein
MKRTTSCLAGLGLVALSVGVSTLGMGCEYQVSGEHRLTSLRMLLQSPMESELGSPSNPVTPSSLKFDVEALDEQGRLMAVDANLSAYIVAGGSRLSLLDPCQSSSTTGDPALLKTIGMRGGKVTGEQVSLSLPAVFGRIAINLEELSSQSLSSTPPIYFPNPTIARLMKPLDVTAGNASFCSPYLARQVTIDGTATAQGKLIVSSLFQSGLAVTDTSSPDYGSMYIFTFSQPSAQLQIGTVLERLSGAIAKFNGMTQLANPTLIPTDVYRPDWVPTPIELDATRRPTGGPTSANNQWLTKYIAAPVRVSGIVCDVTEDDNRKGNWIQYNTVVINQVDMDPKSSTGCGGVNPSFDGGLGTRFNVQLPGKGFAGFDPVVMAGQEATFVGMLQNGASKSGKTLFWTAVVRKTSDVCLKPRAQCP